MGSKQMWWRGWLGLGGLAAVALTAMVSGGGKGSADVPGESADEMTPERVREIAKRAYIYGYPMVDHYRIQYSYFQDAQSSQYVSPWNTLHSAARVYTPADTAVQTPNSDTPYSTLGADLRAEPLVLTVPEVSDDRYYSIQFIDAYTYNMAYVGSRATGNRAGRYLLAGPDWHGEKPAGIDAVIRSETEFAFALYRTQLFGPDDIENVRALQAGYTAVPLSQYLGTEAPAPAPAVDFVVPQTPEEQITSIKFFETLDFVLTYAPVLDSERDLRAEFASIGIGAEGKLDVTALPADIQQALGDGLKDARVEYDQLQERINRGEVTSAQMFGDRATLGTNYLYRMAGAINGIYGNDAAEAVYPIFRTDSAGAALDGANRYVFRFAPGELPPVKGFWSITMYRLPEILLVENPIDRYLINSPMLPSLVQDEDGGYTVYVQNESPGVDKESNWLPTPEGPFVMVERLYWPEQAALDGSWKPASLQRV